MAILAALYLRPDCLSEALDALAARPLTVAAGCTDLFPATERKVLPGDILDITAIDELSGISRTDEGVRIGATTSWSEILQADLPPALDALKLAATEVGAKQIQNRGTIGGNLCNASPAADGVPPLLIVDAEVELSSAEGARRLPLSEFITGPRQTTRQDRELLTAVCLPLQSLAGRSNFLKLGAREHLVISIAMTAARVVEEGGVIETAALSVGACGPVATRLPKIESSLAGTSLNTATLGSLVTDETVAATLSPIDDVRADAGYRAGAAAELLRRTLLDLGDRRLAA
ncbi:MAG: FAD binding domain-containing protein [Pseudomonadota bacterium]